MITKTISAVAGLTLLAGSVAMAGNIKGGFLWSDQGSDVTIVAGDNIPDPVRVFPLKVKGEKFTFIITDADSNVLAYTTNNVFDLDGAGVGACNIYGFSYNGEFDAPTGVNVKELSSSGESSLSRNNITINRVSDGAVDGGWILNDRRGYGRVYVDLSDPKPFRVYSHNEASTSTDYAYIITDNNGRVLGFPPSNSIDLSAAPAGICRVYGVSFTGELDTTTGVQIDQVTSSDGNQSLSQNWVTAVRR